MSNILIGLTGAALLSPDELDKLVRSAPRRYKVYKIPKRKPNQMRTIAQPAREVKVLQYWVMEHVLDGLFVHPAATGYRKKRNIADNARKHTQGHFLLKLDFKNFFPSLEAKDFKAYIDKHKPSLTKYEVEVLTRILFWKPQGTDRLCLSIGAPSSPALSNILLGEFDAMVATFCSKVRTSYTRYADDLSFSTNDTSVLQHVEEEVFNICRKLRSPRLIINQAKTVRVSKKTTRRITGLVITNDGKVSLGRNVKRRIRASVHHFLIGRLSTEEGLRLRGMLAYVKSVEPEFLVRLRKSYGSAVIRKIQTLN